MKIFKILILMALLTSVAFAQGYQIDWYVIASGGDSSSFNNYWVDGTIGQPIVGRTSSTNYIIDAGFWVGAGGHAPGYYRGVVSDLYGVPLEGVSVDAAVQARMMSIDENKFVDDTPVILDWVPVWSDVTDEFGHYMLILEPGTYDITYAKTDWETLVVTGVVIAWDDVFANQDVTLHPTSYQYLAGDVNMALGIWPPSVIGGDVTYLVGYFIGGGQASCLLDGFWCSADINGDCLIIGGDVTALVQYFVAGGALVPCPDYEPLWPPLPPEAPGGWPNCDMPVINSRVIPTGSVK